MNGVIVVDKPFGKTSHDVVGIMRRLTGIKRIGHTGTLDPLATGVLPICIGNATKASEYLSGEIKAYRAEMVLGAETDTKDSEGEIITDQPVLCSKEDILNAAKRFTGEISQLPPMYSAVKVGGKKLYELAREGKTAERTPRKITVYRLDVEETDLERGTAVIYVECSKGTYIRTLISDIGRALGCGAYMNSLVRVKSGKFMIDNAHSLDELFSLAENNSLKSVLIPTDLLFSKYRAFHADEKQTGLIKNGVRIRCKGFSEDERIRVYDNTGKFLCLSYIKEGMAVMEKSFWT